MKNFKIYCIVDVVSEEILSIFAGVSDEFAMRQFFDALKKNKDAIYDINSIQLFKASDVSDFNFTYSVPTSLDEVKKYFIELTEGNADGC